MTILTISIASAIGLSTKIGVVVMFVAVLLCLRYILLVSFAQEVFPVV